MAPHISVIVLIFFCIQLCLDKYNFLYLYPIEFESQAVSRKSIVKNSFYSIILFQIGMISLGTLGNDLLGKKGFVYLYSFVLIQLVIIVTVFEFMRKPWEGVENELERALD